jgi:hypothetical protein
LAGDNCNDISPNPDLYKLDCGDKHGSEFHLDIVSVSAADHLTLWSCTAVSSSLESNQVRVLVDGKYILQETALF